jgi:fido (protein-threonine AMPylation protein)
MARPSRQLLYERLERAVDDLEATVGGLPTVEEARGVWRDIWHEEAHNSTAMEGNTLATREVQLLLFEQRAVGGKEMKAYLEVHGYADAAFWVYGHAFPGGNAPSIETTVGELREIHRRVVGGVWQQFPPDHLDRRDAPGEFRHTNVEQLRPGLTPPEWPQVRSLVTDWVDKVNELPAELASSTHVIEDFADLHAEFERIHPFTDGNGRVGRLVLNLLLIRYGYPPAVINKKDRGKYLDGLRRADEGDPGLLGEVLARAVKHGIDRFLIPGLAGPQRYVPLAALTDLGLSRNALILAAQRGRLEATQRNGQWYSSKRCVEDYKRTKYKRRRAA